MLPFSQIKTLEALLAEAASWTSVSRSQPVLSLKTTGNGAGAGLIFNWPANGVGFALYSTTSLALATSWSLVMNSAVLVNSNSITPWQINLSVSTNAARYYRLKAQ